MFMSFHACHYSGNHGCVGNYCRYFLFIGAGDAPVYRRGARGGQGRGRARLARGRGRGNKLVEQTWLKEVNPLKYLANFFRTFSGR